MRAILSAPQAKHSHALSFCESRHWYFVGGCGPDRAIYCWEPFGSDYTGRDVTPSGAKLQSAIGRLHASGWSVVTIPLAYQSDGYQCGVWVQKVTDAFADYVDGGCMGANFVSYLRAWMERQQPSVCPLGGLHGLARRTAEKRNEQYIREQRVEVRELLIRAAQAGQLDIMTSSLPDFDGSPLVRTIDDGIEDVVVLRKRMEEALVALLSVDDADDCIALVDLLRHMCITEPAAVAQVESILEAMDEDFASSSILMYREGYIYCG